MVDINDFSEEKKCSYKGEVYSVRDNGAVMRHPLENKKPRPTDNKWTFGKRNSAGYMHIGGERINRIVATAFHGTPPDDQYIADHKDTNRLNNRADNLRWLTKLENILLNPITRKKIEYRCGTDIYTILADFPKYRDEFLNAPPDMSWMRTVSEPEAKASLIKILEWTKKENAKESNAKLGEWIYASDTEEKHNCNEEDNNFTKSLTPNAAQIDWKVPSEFPCCPQNPSKDPIMEYFNKLEKGIVFATNSIGQSVIEEVAVSESKDAILIITAIDSGIKPYAVAKVSYDNEIYIHSSLGTFFEYNGAKKVFTKEQGLEWDGGDTFDDYC